MSLSYLTGFGICLINDTVIIKLLLLLLMLLSYTLSAQFVHPDALQLTILSFLNMSKNIRIMKAN